MEKIFASGKMPRIVENKNCDGSIMFQIYGMSGNPAHLANCTTLLMAITKGSDEELMASIAVVRKDLVAGAEKDPEFTQIVMILGQYS